MGQADTLFITTQTLTQKLLDNCSHTRVGGRVCGRVEMGRPCQTLLYLIYCTFYKKNLSYKKKRIEFMNLLIFKMTIMLLSNHLSLKKLDHIYSPPIFRYGNYHSKKISKLNLLTDRALT